jgi:hypothetical protein
MPQILDKLLSHSGNLEEKQREIDNLSNDLDENDVKFLQLGLAYHISRKLNSVRLSTKIIVKKYQKEERKMEVKEEKTMQEKGTEKTIEEKGTEKTTPAKELPKNPDEIQLYLNGQA